MSTNSNLVSDEWFCYLLINTSNTSTYVGVTKNLEKRLRQHNGEISGGAKATSGKHWKRVCYVKNFPNSIAALQFEWRWKNLTKQVWNITHNVLERRVEALLKLTALEKPTEKAVPYHTYPNKLNLMIEDRRITEMIQDKTIPENIQIFY